MRDLHTCGAITLHVGQLGVEVGLIEEAGDDEARVVEHYLYVDVLSGLHQEAKPMRHRIRSQYHCMCALSRVNSSQVSYRTFIIAGM